MLTNLNAFPDQATFLESLYNFLVSLEAPRTNVYPDIATPARPTIGVGFNLAVPSSLDAVLRGMGFQWIQRTCKV